MISKKNIQKILSLCLGSVLLGFYSAVQPLPPLNVSKLSDRFLLPNIWPDSTFYFTFGYERSIHNKGFWDDADECCQTGAFCPALKNPVNALQLYQPRQNVLAALKGSSPGSAVGQWCQRFNIHDENGMQGFFIPKGNFRIPINAMFGMYYQFSPSFFLEFFLPFYAMELHNVRWKLDNKNNILEEEPIKDSLLYDIQKIAGIDLHDWKRTGVGDLLIQFDWLRDFPQMKPLLKNVRTLARIGVSIPTGKKTDEDKLIAFPFGNDGSWGVQAGGGLGLQFGCNLVGGFDVELLYLFGNTRCRRVKTDSAQTDLLFPTKVMAFREFGLSQQYNVFLESFWHGFIFKLYYQYLKRNEDRLYVCSEKLDPIVVNSAESLQDWTAHSLIFNSSYDVAYLCPPSWYKPQASCWFKFGFNGKRAVLLNMVGFAFTMKF